MGKKVDDFDGANAKAALKHAVRANRIREYCSISIQKKEVYLMIQKIQVIQRRCMCIRNCCSKKNVGISQSASQKHILTLQGLNKKLKYVNPIIHFTYPITDETTQTSM